MQILIFWRPTINVLIVFKPKYNYEFEQIKEIC